MEGGRRSSTSSTALLFLLALILLAASSTTTTAAAAASYKLITVQTSRGSQARLAVREDDSSIASFANGQNDWFALQGTEDLMQPLRNRYGGAGAGGDIPGHGFLNLLGALVKKNATK